MLACWKKSLAYYCSLSKYSFYKVTKHLRKEVGSLSTRSVAVPFVRVTDKGVVMCTFFSGW